MSRKTNKSGSLLARIGKYFNKEIEEIKEERLKLGMDKKKKSTRLLTNLIIKHQNWGKIKQDTINIKLEGNNNE